MKKSSIFIVILAVILTAIATTFAAEPQPLMAEVYSLDLHYGVGWIVTARLSAVPDSIGRSGQNVTLFDGVKLGRVVGQAYAQFINHDGCDYADVMVSSIFFEWNEKKFNKKFPVEFILDNQHVVITGWKK